MLQFAPKELQLVDSRSLKLLFSKPLGRRGDLEAALAGLRGSISCSVHSTHFQAEDGPAGDDGRPVSSGQEQLHVLLEVLLLERFYELDPDSEATMHVAALVRHWEDLEDCCTDPDGSGFPFAKELQQGWWQQQKQQQPKQQLPPPLGAAVVADAAVEVAEAGGQPDNATAAGNGAATAAAPTAAAAAASGNLRDRLFDVVLPSDWQLEAAEPPGLACTLFRYQRRCLSWLKWRESLGGGGGSDGGGAGGSSSAAGGGRGNPAAAAAAGAAEGGRPASAPDARSSKAVLPSSSLLWQPTVLPSGVHVYYNAVEGRMSRQPVQPPLPEVPGGLLCDEMGLGKTVEMLALFLANPPPYRQQQVSGQAADGSPEQQLPASGISEPDAGQGAAPAATQPAAAAAPCLPSTTTAAPAMNGSKSSSKGGSSSSSGGGGGSGKQAPRGGTLVVCPPALLQQWQSEVANHAHGALTVEIYDGLRGLSTALQGEEGSRVKRQKPAQREMELYARLLAGEAVAASFDSAAEVEAALRRLQQADVVLTSFDVLRAEVYFVPSVRSFRHPKKYAVPHCPLLQVNWWRLVIDEAQMVGPLSAAGTMCERMQAVHRWCVTGTPMGSHRNELTDIHALLHTLQHQPFADAATWRQLLADPIAEEGPAAPQAWQLLSSVLRPLMWRNTKGVVAQEFHLPPRSLKPTWLHFQAGERAFYDQVVDKTRKAREELLSFRTQQREQQQGGQGQDADEPASPAAERTRKRRQSKQGEKLELAAAENITQLRLACIHPQLTKSWRDMAAEGQLGVGGATLSMEEVMQRLVDQSRFELQEAERNLCGHLNTLAMRLLAKAAEAPPNASSSEAAVGAPSGSRAPLADEADPEGAGGSKAAAAAGQQEEGETAAGAASPRPAKRARKSKGGGEVPCREALQSKAQLLLEQSYRVAEKGIAALDVGMDALKGMPDIEAASTSTVNAWKRLQINTSSQLGKLHAAAGRAEEAQKMDVDVQEKVSYLRSQAEMELQAAQQRLDQLQQAAGAARQAFRLHLEAAAERGFIGGMWGLTAGAKGWLAGMEASYLEAKREEELELEVQEGNVKHMLGSRVSSTLDDVDKQLHGELTQLDRYVSEQQLAAAHRRLLREQQRWDDTASASRSGGSSGGGGGSNGGGESGGSSGSGGQPAAWLAGGVQFLWDLLLLLPDFRRKTLQAQHVVLFMDQLAAEAGRKEREAAQRKGEQAAVKVAAAAAAAGSPADTPEAAGDGEVVVLGDGKRPQQQQDQQQAAAVEEGHQDLLAVEHGQQGGAAAAAAATAGQRGEDQQQSEDSTALAAILQAASDGQAFAASGCWRGQVAGYCFKLGDSGLGYYRDTPPPFEAFLTLGRLQFVANVVGRALQDQQRRLARNAGPEAALFASLSLDAVEAKLESVKQQIHLVRALKEQHISERTVALKAALQEDLDAELQAAAHHPPLPAAGSVEKLQKEVDSLKERAVTLLHRMRYMASRVSEARQLHGNGTGSDYQQQQRQEQQQASDQQQVPDLGPAEQRQQPTGHGEQRDDNGELCGALAAPAMPAGAAAAAASNSGAARNHQPAGSGDGAGPSNGAAAGMAGPSAAAAVAAADDYHAGMECPVCLTLVPAGDDINVFSGCGHAFCKDCAHKLVLQQGFCAVCRQKVTRKQVFRVAAGGGRGGSGACDPEFEALGKIQPQGEWSVKVEGLLRRLLYLQTTAPAEKCLVFSQFPDALKLVALALQTNGIRFVQLLGGRQAARKAVSAFRDDEDVRVFLLSHRAGAAGLTLVRASHVFLLEPALEPAIEQQAVARVHRIGQQRPVNVTRLLIKDSIEHRVLAVQEAKHALFAGAGGGAEDTAELATTVEAPVGHETLAQDVMQGLLDAV